MQNLRFNHRQNPTANSNENVYEYDIQVTSPNDVSCNDDCSRTDDTAYLNAPQYQGKLTKYLAFCLSICAIGCSFQVGWNIGIYNTPIKVFKQFFNETYINKNSRPMSESTWTALWSITNGLMPLGGVVGGLASGYAADYFGRKKLMFMVNGLVILSGFITCTSKLVHSYLPIVIGRFITGVYCGLFSGVGPIYLAEIAPRNLRGAAGALHQLALVIGILSTNTLGLPFLLGTLDLWPYLVGITIVPAVVQFVFLPFCAETPKYLYINKNDPTLAAQVLRKLRGIRNEELLIRELEELYAEKQLRLKQHLVSFKDLVTKPLLRKPLILTIVIQLSQQFSGINSIALYSTNMFISIGLDPNTWAVYATIIIDIFKVTITIVCVLLIEISGRRRLLLIGLIGMSVFSFALAIFPKISPENQSLKYVTVASAVAYVIFFSIGPGSIPWLITAELFASDSRGKATSVAVFTNWVSNFVVSTSIPLIMASINNDIYIIFGVLIIVFVIFIYMKVPETKKKSIEEISKHFR